MALNLIFQTAKVYALTLFSNASAVYTQQRKAKWTGQERNSFQQEMLDGATERGKAIQLYKH